MEFNTKLGRSKGMRVHLPDGIAFVNEEASWWDKTFHKSLSRWVRVPGDRETMHFLIVDDSGTGKCFNDIASGNNGGFKAAKGWDACTGLGSPMGTKIITLLSAAVKATPPI